MKYTDQAFIALRRLEYFVKCNILGFPRRQVTKTIQYREDPTSQNTSDSEERDILLIPREAPREAKPDMPHGAFQLLRIRNRWLHFT